MKLAFTSCVSAQTFTQQPVWDQIGASGATQLVLLGDSAYYDADGSSMGAVQAMTTHAFATHAFNRLRDQLQQPQFSALIRKPSLTTHAIWDDHDFLFNGACGAQIAGQPTLSHLLSPTRAAFLAFRRALARQAPFPTSPYYTGQEVAPGYTCVALEAGIWLHLTDGRSFKSKGGASALMGAAQMDQIEAAMDEIALTQPDAVHLLASGVVFEVGYGESWLDCQAEHDRLLTLAARHRILMLSGDIHENRFASPYGAPGQRPLLEATSSGAALRKAVTLGAPQCNWGLLDIQPGKIVVQLSQIGLPVRQRTIDRGSWTMV